jgi:signal transduction histidine kinase
MPVAVRRRALEPLFTTKAAGKGSGLGLPMVDGFVRQSGGRLGISSTPDEGTRINLYLPRAVQSLP